MSGPDTGTEAAFDVAVIGGALAGGAVAWLLRQEFPDLKVLVVERAARHGRRVGEATVEVSACFLMRALGLTEHLLHHHLPKQGLRFWFGQGQAGSLADASELGGRYLARVPSFQVDRAVLDEEVLRRAGAAGAVVWRPAVVRRVDLQPGGEQFVTVEQNGETRRVRARWVVDASGFATLLARQEGWREVNTDHPTTTAWARWRGVKNLDGLELARRHPAWALACHGLRGTATNHLMGDGWWAWLIPLAGGETSVGVVFDQRLVQWPAGGALGARLKEFLCRHPAGRELLEDAEWIEDDVHWRSALAYRVTTLAGDGFVLVGDAAGFLDPFYSPGMDWLSFTVSRAVDVIAAHRRGADVAPLLAAYQRDFTDSYRLWFEAIYRDKYAYLGDFELMRVAFPLDVGAYYLGVASQPYRRGAAGFREPVFTTTGGRVVQRLMRAYHTRLVALARARRRRGVLGRANAGRRKLLNGFSFGPSGAWPLIRALGAWARLELAEGWRAWPARPAEPAQAASAAATEVAAK